MPPARRPLADRFWEKVDKKSAAECWPWLAAKDPNGYGRMQVYLKDKWGTKLVTRISYALEYGPIPNKLFICHRCDHPWCVNPKHLFLGTQADNMQDAARKGRVPNRNTGHYQADKTHCVRGHEYTPENTYYPPGRYQRWCRTCQRMHVRNFRAQKRKELENENI